MLFVDPDCGVVVDQGSLVSKLPRRAFRHARVRPSAEEMSDGEVFLMPGHAIQVGDCRREIRDRLTPGAVLKVHDTQVELGVGIRDRTLPASIPLTLFGVT